MRHELALLAPLLLAGCLGPDPAATAARQYAADLAPVLDENGLLATTVLDAAADVYNGKSSPQQTLEVWTADIVPISEHLRDQALLVDPPHEWSADHKGLTDIWASRADAYRDIAEALRTGDAGLWKQGRESADAAKLDEETWFRTANDRVAAYGIVFDQYP